MPKHRSLRPAARKARVTRRDVLLGAAAVAAQSVLPRDDSDASRPNILIIYSDDQAPQTLGCYGNKRIRTPNLDKLAAQGLVCTRAYTPVPLCAPSRAALLTSTYPHESGVLRNKESAFDPQLPTFATHLRKAGYFCGLVGKWHLGDVPKPQAGFLDYWAALDIDPASTPFAKRHMEPKVWKDGKLERHEAFATDVLTDYALDFLRQRRDEKQPFLLWVAYRCPHFPFVAPPNTALHYQKKDLRLPPSSKDDLAKKPVFQADDAMHRNYLAADEDTLLEQLGLYYSMIGSIDSNVGRLLSALDDGKPARPTLVLFSTDNGWLFGEHQLYGKGAAMYDELVRVPLLFRWPGKIAPGRTTDALISTMDLFPTFASIAGTRPPNGLRGMDLLPLFEDRARTVHDELFFEYDKGETDNYPAPMLAVMTPRFKLNRYLKNGEEEMYDLVKDPAEMTNLIDQDSFADDRKKLRERLDDFKNRIEIPYWK